MGCSHNQAWLEEVWITWRKQPGLGPYVALDWYGLQFGRHASLASYNPYKFSYEREPTVPNSIWKKLALVVDLDDPNIWAECLHMAMENMSIAQHHECEHYACIRSGAYKPQLRRFRQRNNVYLQHEVPTTLDVRVGALSFG